MHEHWQMSTRVNLNINFRLNIIYRWCHDIGRENAANKPLLKTVFQVLKPYFPSQIIITDSVYNILVSICWKVMMRLFSPRKTTLLFVIRDKTKVWISLAGCIANIMPCENATS